MKLKWENAATPPTTYITIVQADDDVAVYGLDGDDLVVTYGNPPDWDAAGYCDWGAEFPETQKTAEALLRALRAERTVLGDAGYTCHTLGFSLNEHAVLERWVGAKRPDPGEYVVGDEHEPAGSPLRVLVHHDLYITRRVNESIAELRERFPRADTLYAGKAIELYEAARRYNAARAQLDPDSDPDALAHQIRLTQEAKDQLIAVDRRNR